MWTVVHHELFEYIFIILVLANTLVLCLDYYNMSSDRKQTLDVVNDILSIIFFLEFLIKIVALPLPEYIANKSNILDAVLVLLSIPSTVSNQFADRYVIASSWSVIYIL
jgi:hypothetical protein